MVRAFNVKSVLNIVVAHNLFEDFEWFIVMDENDQNTQNSYCAMEVEETVLLRGPNTGREHVETSEDFPPSTNHSLLAHHTHNQRTLLQTSLIAS